MVSVSTLFAYLIGLPLGVCCLRPPARHPRNATVTGAGLGGSNRGSIPFISSSCPIPFRSGLGRPLAPRRHCAAGHRLGPLCGPFGRTKLRRSGHRVIEAAKCMGADRFTSSYMCYWAIGPSLIRGFPYGITLIGIPPCGCCGVRAALETSAIRYCYHRYQPT